MIQADILKNIPGGDMQHKVSVNKTFQNGTITQVLGISGIGKSTFLKMLAGFIKPDEGRIIVNNFTWFSSNENINLTPQERRAGFVFQDYALFPNMNVKEHLQYGSNDENHVQMLLELGRLKSLENRRPRQLSGGQQQRLAILRALSTKPEVLLMDEPFSAMDLQLRIELMTDLRKLILQSGTTCVVVTHDRLEKFADDSFEMF